MKRTSRTIVFFGTDKFSLIALKALVETGHHIAAVVTKPDSRSGRGQKIQESEVKKYAKEHGINILQPQKVSDIIPVIESIQPKPIGVLSSFGKIIPQSIIDLFSPGIINIHPSLLPKYRGPSPIESSILNCDNETGVSIMLLDAEMDSGPIYNQTRYQLNGQETTIELSEMLGNIGAKDLIDVLISIEQDDLQPKVQDHNKATYCSLIKKQDAYIDPSKDTAKIAEAKVRAYRDFPKAKLNLSDKTLIVTKAHTSKEPASAIDIKCSDGQYLSIEEIIAPSGKTMTAQAFCSGYIK